MEAIVPAYVQGGYPTLGDSVVATLEKADYNYASRYPGGADLKPGSALHGSILSRLLIMARASRATIDNRIASWDAIDEHLTAYIDLSKQQQEDIKTEGYVKSSRKSVSVVVPMAYAVMETLLTYLCSAFLDEPIFRYDWVGDEDAMGCILLERLIDIQSRRSKVALNLHTQWRDALAYGIGPATTVWHTRVEPVTVVKDVIKRNVFGRKQKVGESVTEEEAIVEEWNRLDNISPRMYLPDPNVSVHDVQRGEFVGWYRRNNFMDLLSEEQFNDRLFNVQYLKHLGQGISTLVSETSSSAATKSGRPEASSAMTGITRPIDELFMYVKIIPSDWGLGGGKYPEKWLFSVAGDQIITRASPLGLRHGMFPVVAAAPDFDGYSVTPISRLETIYEIQKCVDWLLTSHMANVRKAINDMIIYDPSILRADDIENPTPGMLVRMRQSAWGRGKVSDYIYQLKVADVTQNHTADIEVMGNIVQRYTGAVDSLQGIMRRGSERRSAAEAKDTHMSALSRLAKMAKMVSIQSMQDIAMFFGYHAQQLMSSTAYVKTVGSLEEQLRKEFGLEAKRGRIAIHPPQLQIQFDAIPHDGTVPGGQNIDAVIQAFQIAAAQPGIASGLDMTRVFLHIMRESGVRNIDQFLVKGKAQSMENIQRGVEKGNMIPYQQAGPNELAA